MQNGKLHLFFHSELDSPQLWRAALAEQLDELITPHVAGLSEPQQAGQGY